MMLRSSECQNDIYIYGCATDSFRLCSHSWIDVRDLAHAHVLAVQTPAAGGERFIVSAGDFRWQDFSMCKRIL